MKTNGFKNIHTFNLYMEIISDFYFDRSCYTLLHRHFFEGTLWTDDSEFDLYQLAEYLQIRGFIEETIELNKIDFNEITLKLCQDHRDGRNTTSIKKKVYEQAY